MNNHISDMAILTGIPEKTLEKFYKKVSYEIIETLYESIIAEEEISEIDVGIGTLFIKHQDKNIKYKFEPKADLAKSIEQVVFTRKNPAQNALNTTLATKFVNVYKDICE